MHCLYAVSAQMPELEQAVAAERLDDVTIKTPFMGRVVVWCGSDRSRDVLQRVLAARELTAA